MPSSSSSSSNSASPTSSLSPDSPPSSLTPPTSPSPIVDDQLEYYKKQEFEATAKIQEQIREDLANLGVTSPDEVEGCCQLGAEMYRSRKEYEILPNPPYKTTNAGVIPMYCDGYRLICFYRGFQDSALPRLKATAKWRKDNECNRIRTQYLPEVINCDANQTKQFEQIYQAGLLGINKDGQAIVIRRFGKLDMKQLKKIVGGGKSSKPAAEYFWDSHIWEMEHFYELSREMSLKNKRITKGRVVVDLDGVTFKQLGGETMKVVKRLITSDSDNYPDTLRKLYIINAPGIFNFIWKMIRPLLDPVTLAKIEICKKDRIFGALKEAGAPDMCLSIKNGGTAFPIKGVTNSECFLPFGGTDHVPPNSVEKWNAELILKQCSEEVERKAGTSPKRSSAASDNYYQSWRSGGDFTPTRKQAAFEEKESLRLKKTTKDDSGVSLLLITTFLLLICYVVLAILWTSYGPKDLWGQVWGEEL
mmetsp:Transcript_23444/g.48816  ORF Transcript_23444/g.48816 Transcript_23444/m.48816 type:complete len:475 (-) Transcript_23444:35-1459(-)